MYETIASMLSFNNVTVIQLFFCFNGFVLAVKFINYHNRYMKFGAEQFWYALSDRYLR